MAHKSQLAAREGKDQTDAETCTARKSPECCKGKLFHDPLAACCAIDSDIGQWAEVELFREKGQWGSTLAPGSGLQIITAYDPSVLLRTLLGGSLC